MKMMATVSKNLDIPGNKIPMGTTIEVSGVFAKRQAVSGKCFLVSKCGEHPSLIGKTICTSLVENASDIIKALESKDLTKESKDLTNKKLLLII